MGEIDEYETSIQNLIYAANIQNAMTEDEKVLAIHDALCNWVQYDYSRTYYSGYDIIVKRHGVCQAYAEAFNTLLERIGIESVIAVSWEMDHAWNVNCQIISSKSASI